MGRSVAPCPRRRPKRIDLRSIPSPARRNGPREPEEDLSRQRCGRGASGGDDGHFGQLSVSSLGHFIEPLRHRPSRTSRGWTSRRDPPVSVSPAASLILRELAQRVRLRCAAGDPWGLASDGLFQLRGFRVSFALRIAAVLADVPRRWPAEAGVTVGKRSDGDAAARLTVTRTIPLLLRVVSCQSVQNIKFAERALRRSSIWGRLPRWGAWGLA